MSGSRVVSGSEIEAEFEQDITTVNPPVLQGWTVIAMVVAIVGEVAGLVAIADGDLSLAITLFVGSAAGWMIAVGVVGAFQREIAPGSTGVVVRRWTDVWLGRAGVRLGEPSAVRIGHVGADRLEIEGDEQTITFDISLWPRSARHDLAEEPPLWGVLVEPPPGDRHRRRHPDVD